MKKWFWWLGALALVWVAPRLNHPAVDLGNLTPVEVIALNVENGQVEIRTDTGDVGQGDDLAQAVENLKAQAPRALFLESGDKLLVSGEVEGLWQEIFGLFRPNCQICLAEENLDLDLAGAYLNAHPVPQTLGNLRGTGVIKYQLEIKEGRGRLVPVG